MTKNKRPAARMSPVFLAAVLGFSGAHAASHRSPWKLFQHANGVSIYLGPAVRRIMRQYVLVVYDRPQPMPPYATNAPDQLYVSEVTWLQIECPPPGMPTTASVLDVMKYFYPIADPGEISIDGSGSNGVLGMPNGPAPRLAPSGSVVAYIAAMDCKKWLAAAK